MQVCRNIWIHHAWNMTQPVHTPPCGTTCLKVFYVHFEPVCLLQWRDGLFFLSDWVKGQRISSCHCQDSHSLGNHGTKTPWPHCIRFMHKNVAVCAIHVDRLHLDFVWVSMRRETHALTVISCAPPMRSLVRASNVSPVLVDYPGRYVHLLKGETPLPSLSSCSHCFQLPTKTQHKQELENFQTNSSGNSWKISVI